MSAWLVSQSARLCRSWVRIYTHHLPTDAAERRHQEIESDLFEHHAEATNAGVTGHRLAAEVLGRVLVGVPADLTWRRAEQHEPIPRLRLGGTSMSLSNTTTNRLLTTLGVLVIVYVWGVILLDAFFFPAAEDENGWKLKVLFGIGPVAATIALAIGLRIRAKAPRRGFRLIAAGAIGPAIWFWMLPIYAPLMIATIMVATLATPRKKIQNPPTVAPV